ncbi:MAG: bifunctional 5,10-methylenetetrahydrofolate dehydrogenase/5,10-methenyltetrahydrofolate cyclohydrolase [Candidatus Sungbacteria bacterium]|uniref:Bifunctional protein FolD n=1 Tax=Candidatus Sungiibacteriota bacterium TaxID=2750080 RepID=A0A932YVA6_9BACT|nr:bifunctional 5,10-methylenetetrahydrofolate dehydrogenase/5,10-methenyltetrahydrofolate cyclohydrolase [Candidatus Sungbacteria bacterium]
MVIIMDGKALADKIITGLKPEYARLGKKPALAAIVVGGDAVIRKFIERKKNVAGEFGVDFRVYEYPADISTNELRKRIAQIVHDADPEGVIIQLPLPPHVNQQYILNSVPPEKDVDVLSARAVGDFSVGKSRILPPVVGAIAALFQEYGIDYRSKHVVVVGAGTLVGKPVAAWLANEKVSFTVVDEHTPDIAEFSRKADVIISGVGRLGLITGNMVKEGAVVIDAGTSEAGGPSTALGASKFVGDVDSDSVSPKASYITPVPGGVGPLTVAMIYKNLLTLARC